MTKGLVRELRKLVSKERYEDAAALAFSHLRKQPAGSAPKEVLDILETCARKSDTTAFAVLRMYTLGLVKEGRDGDAAAIGERLMKSRDRNVSRHGHLVMGLHHATHGRPHLGMKILRDALAKGYDEAKIVMALIYVSGAPGLEADLGRGIMMLLEAVEDGIPTSRVMLARIVIERGVTVEGLDVEKMLGDAVEDGDMAAEAMRMLDEIADRDFDFDDEDDEDGFDDEDQHRDILSYEVIPDGMDRMAAARDALMHTFGMPGDVAETTIARVSGFCCWRHMEMAACNPDFPKGVFDEDIGEDELAERQAEQAEVLQSQGFLDDLIAEKVAKRLAVTSRKGTPSFKGLRHELEDEGYADGPPDESASGMTVEGLESFMRFIEKAHSIRPKAWLNTLESFGWSLQSMRPKARKEGSLVARTTASDGVGYDVFLSGGMYLPGEGGDVRVETCMDDIARKGRPAVLLFNRPVGYIDPGAPKGMLFGGKMFSGQEWWDFVLRPGANVDDAVRQRGKMQARPGAAFFRKYSFAMAQEACTELAATSSGTKLEDGVSVTYLRNEDGWAMPFIGPDWEFFQAALRQMR